MLLIQSAYVIKGYKGLIGLEIIENMDTPTPRLFFLLFVNTRLLLGPMMSVIPAPTMGLV